MLHSFIVFFFTKSSYSYFIYCIFNFFCIIFMNAKCYANKIGHFFISQMCLVALFR